jgi:hypothetical protein
MSDQDSRPDPDRSMSGERVRRHIAKLLQQLITGTRPTERRAEEWAPACVARRRRKKGTGPEG